MIRILFVYIRFFIEIPFKKKKKTPHTYCLTVPYPLIGTKEVSHTAVLALLLTDDLCLCLRFIQGSIVYCWKCLMRIDW